MITLSGLAAGLLQRHQHARGFGVQPGTGVVGLPVTVATLHHGLDLVQARFQALGGVLHPDVRAPHHLLGRQTPPGGRYQWRHGLAVGIGRTPAAIRQHDHPGRDGPMSAERRGHRQGKASRRLARAPLARRTRQGYGHQRFQLCGGRCITFGLEFWLGSDDVYSGVEHANAVRLFGHRSDVQRRTGYDLKQHIDKSINENRHQCGKV